MNDLPKYIGTKVVEAAKIVEIESLDHPTVRRIRARVSPTTLTCWDVPIEWCEKYQPKPGDYFVRYDNGHESVSPAPALEPAYRLAEGADQALTFGDAMHFLKAGRRVTRKGGVMYSGSAAWIELDSTGQVLVKQPTGNPYLWEPSLADVMAEDWMVLPIVPNVGTINPETGAA